MVFPAVRGGEQTLRELVHDYKTEGPVYRRTVQTTLRASYTNHYREGLIELLSVLDFRSNNTGHRPVIDALALVARYAKAGNIIYCPLCEGMPGRRGTAGPVGVASYTGATELERARHPLGRTDHRPACVPRCR